MLDGEQSTEPGELTADLVEGYIGLLVRLWQTKDTALLDEAPALSRAFVAARVGPREIEAVHSRAMASLDSALTDADSIANRLLLEVLIGYGVAYSSFTDHLLAEADTANAQNQAHVEDAQRAETERLTLLAGVSHELGNPLMIVKANVKAIRQSLEDRGSWPPDLTQREDDVEFAVERMLALREELLAASRNELRQLDAVPVHLSRLVARVVRWARAVAAEKSISLNEVYTAEAAIVLADESAVQSVLSNLLSNAIRYTGKNGHVTVEVRRQDSFIVVAVTDDGIGISERDRTRIFERFYRTAAAKKAVPFGLGLGLAITRDLVTAMRGTIECKARPGGGSVFEVAFPAMDLAGGEE